MRISVSDAAEQLDELIDRAAAGEDIVLTLDGRDAVRMMPAKRGAKAGDDGPPDRPR
jgi:prevent-host-death family protein